MLYHKLKENYMYNLIKKKKTFLTIFQILFPCADDISTFYTIVSPEIRWGAQF